MPSFDYSDIIDLPYPRDDWNFLMKHPRMATVARAKIFSPFAALRGHTDAIDETAKRNLNVNRDDLLEDGMSELEDSFALLVSALDAGEHPEVRVTFFVQGAESSEGVGTYETVVGVAKKVDPVTRVLFVADRQIPLQDIRKLDAEGRLLQQR
ncbi:MAG: hypothetical protein MJY99_00605 [Fibrobacter sp.]|nr:hypothetical protein [Fibrobacter sp.]